MVERLELFAECQAEKAEKDVYKRQPYYTWANRGENEMQVWTRVQNP